MFSGRKLRSHPEAGFIAEGCGGVILKAVGLKNLGWFLEEKQKRDSSLALRMTKQNQALTAFRTTKPKQAQILPRFAPQDDNHFR